MIDGPSRILIRAVEIAEKETWVREIRKNDSPRIREYQAVCGIAPPEPYCACFIAWCIVKACEELGYRLKAKYYDAYTPTFYKRLPVKLHSKRNRIQRGDLFFVFSPTMGRISHVGILASDLRSDGSFATIEGNTNLSGSREGDGVYKGKRWNSDRIIFARFTDEHIIEMAA